MSEKNCKICGLPLSFCSCGVLKRQDAESIKVYLEKRKWGKFVTIISGIDSKDINLGKLAKKLKGKLATGGTAKDGKIELQGRHVNELRKILVKEGFSESNIDFILR